MPLNIALLALCRWRKTTWPRCTSAQRNIQRLLSSWEWWIDGRVTIAFRMNENPNHETHHDCLPVPYTTTSIYHLLSQCSLSYKLTEKRTLGQMKTTTCCWIRAIFNSLYYFDGFNSEPLHFQRWISSCSAASCLTVSIERFKELFPSNRNLVQMLFKIRRDSRGIYLINAASRVQPQSLWSCIKIMSSNSICCLSL